MMMKKGNRNIRAPRLFRSFVGGVLLLLTVSLTSAANAETTSDEKIKALENTVDVLMKKVQQLEKRLSTQTTESQQQKASIATISENIEKIESAPQSSLDPVFDKLHIGGYGELHGNFGEGDDADQIDLHRLVFYFGYDFTDWIKFNSEFEIEHGFVTDDAGGEFVVEQAYFDFLLSDSINVRAGRVLTPLAITNQFHEPTLFDSVERSPFDTYIIPTAWSSDGIGIFGDLSDELKYEAYVVGGLDGSEFDDVKGIRDGRIKERPDLSDPSFTGRLDYFPFVNSDRDDNLRLGISGYAGSLNNGNKGVEPGVNGDISILSGDFQYSVSKFDFTGAIAHTKISGARSFGDNTASEIFGWYLEAGYHYWPDAWKKGKFAQTDATLFVRYTDFDTQYDMPSGSVANPAGDRNDITIGTAVKLTPNFVIKADYQIRDDATGDGLGDKINLGIGYSF